MSPSWLVRMLREARTGMRGLLDAQWAAISTGADALVYHPKALGGASIAERLGIPAFVALPLPGLTPTRAFPSPMLPLANLGLLNTLSHRLVLRTAEALFRAPVDGWRRERLGLPPAGQSHTVGGIPVPRLYPYSQHVLPRPPDWSQDNYVTGYWFLDEPGEWRPDPALRTFLRAGPPPVYVGFGSVPSADPATTTALVAEALSIAGQRGILATGWGGLAHGAAAQHVHVIASAPHDRLFPLVSAVVHHGGAGTTAAGLRAGKPTVVCPAFGDQPFWGRRLAALGVGPSPIHRRHLTPRALARAIRHAVEDGGIRERAAALGARIRAEDGVRQAIGLIARRTASRTD